MWLLGGGDLGAEIRMIYEGLKGEFTRQREQEVCGGGRMEECDVKAPVTGTWLGREV